MDIPVANGLQGHSLKSHNKVHKFLDTPDETCCFTLASEATNRYFLYRPQLNKQRCFIPEIKIYVFFATLFSYFSLSVKQWPYQLKIEVENDVF